MNTLETMERWSCFLTKVRQFFNKRGYLEVTTPTLVLSPGVDASIDFWKAVWGKETVYLPTSPELSLKKLLAAGAKQIYEIKPCFRGDYSSEVHLQEFHMLEWYQVGLSLEDLVEETLYFVQEFIHIKNKVTRVSLPEFFRTELDVDIQANSSLDKLKGFCKKLNIDTAIDDSWIDLYQRIYMEKVETKLEGMGLVVITDFPKQLASLSQISSKGWAERFEIYYNGVELANAFNELLCPRENRRRFEEQRQIRLDQGKEPMPIDEVFLQSLEKGLPECVGIALGLERLFMLANNLEDVNFLKKIYED